MTDQQRHLREVLDKHLKKRGLYKWLHKIPELRMAVEAAFMEVCDERQGC